MNRFLRSCMPVLCVGLALSRCAIAQAPPAAPAGPAGGPPGGGARAPYVPKNLKILPDNTDLRTVMRGYAGALGVNCEFCHTAADPVTKRADRASDANPMKDTARTMIQMTMDLNGKYLTLISKPESKDPVTCGTCHRGQKYPSVFVPPPPPEGNRPPGAAPAGAPPATAPPGY